MPPLESASPHDRGKSKLRRLLATGAGSLVVATTVVVTTAAPAALSPAAASLTERVAEARATLIAPASPWGPDGARDARLAWHAWHNWQDSQYHDQVWNNVPSWHNLGYQDPRWQNWQNWHDWNDWRNH